MAENSEIANYVVTVLSRKTGLSAVEIRPDSRLLHDLAIDGDDALEAVTEISERFSIDVSRFEFQQYFRSEPTLLSLSSRDAVSDKRPLTVADLVDAARTGVLT